jgi:hypothetical protein
MSIDFLKAQANRLAHHLADKHGIKLKHAAVLEAIAAVHGVRDWNTLRAAAAPGYQPGPLALEPEHIRVPHTLIIGSQDVGAAVLLEQMAVQHIGEGGGLLYFSPYADPKLDDVLRHAAAEAEHKPQVLSLAPPDPEGVETCVPRLEALVQSGFIMHVAPLAGERVSNTHAGTCLLLRQLNAVLSATRPVGARTQPATPLMVVLPAARFDLCWLSILRQGRSMGVTFVLQADSPSDLDRLGLVFLNTVTQNVGTQLLLTPSSQLGLARTVSHVMTMARVSQQQVAAVLGAMGPGEALRVREGVLESIRYDGLSAEVTVLGRGA